MQGYWTRKQLARAFEDERNREPSWSQIALLWAVVILVLVFTGIV